MKNKYTLFYKQHFYKQHQAEIGKKKMGDILKNVQKTSVSVWTRLYD